MPQRFINRWFLLYFLYQTGPPPKNNTRQLIQPGHVTKFIYLITGTWAISTPGAWTASLRALLLAESADPKDDQQFMLSVRLCEERSEASHLLSLWRCLTLGVCDFLLQIRVR